jgi:sn-1 stearoyl-lipid 9-desaturase
MFMHFKRFSWGVALGLLLIHLIAVAAFLPIFFSWSGVAVALILWWMTGAFGIALCFHRTLTHRSLTMPRWLEYTSAFFGTLSLQGGPIEWVATHRLHHAHADDEGDPHDAHRGLIWTHIDWLYRPNDARPNVDEQQRYAADLVAQPYYRFLQKYQLLLQIALGLALFAMGGLSWVVWGIFFRLVFVYHITWFVNSAAHKYGYRTFKTDDLSTNCWWVAIMTWGEGWHNNHHAFPFSARHGLRWFEFDPTWIQIRVLKALRLVRDIKLPTPAMVERLTAQPRPLQNS